MHNSLPISPRKHVAVEWWVLKLKSPHNLLMLLLESIHQLVLSLPQLAAWSRKTTNKTFQPHMLQTNQRTIHAVALLFGRHWMLRCSSLYEWACWSHQRTPEVLCRLLWTFNRTQGSHEGVRPLLALKCLSRYLQKWQTHTQNDSFAMKEKESH